MMGFPLVEILAAVGMTNARPYRTNKLEYRYSVFGRQNGCLLDPIFLRIAIGAEKNPIPSFPFRRFTMQLDWPGKENQARCIANVTEDNIQ